MSNAIAINGAFGKFIAAVVIALLIAGVVGIWNMNATLNRLVVTVSFIKEAQMKMDLEVQENADGIEILKLDTSRFIRDRNE